MENYDNQYNSDWQQTPPQPPIKQQNNLAIASMIVSIFGLLACCIPPLQFVLGMAALLLAIFSKKGKPFSGFAIAGLVMSIFCLVISIAMVLYLVFAFNMMKDPQYGPMINEILQMYEEMYETVPVN